MKKTSKYISAGHPPDSIVFIGDKKMDKPEMVLYKLGNGFQSENIESVSMLKKEIDTGNIHWLHCNGVSDVDMLKELGNLYKIHPLILADIANTEHSPKIEFLGEQIFLEIRAISYNEQSSEIDSEQVSFILGGNYLLSFLEKDNNCFKSIIERYSSNVSKSTPSPGFIIYSLFDSIVDSYYQILEKIGEDIEEVEDVILAKPTPAELERIHIIKRNLIFMRKAIWPLREIIRRLEVEGADLLDTASGLYIRDLYEHIIQIIDTVETQRELIAEILDVYLSSVSYKLNEIMRVLTVISTIFMPLTFISSIYGMNFKFMPELDWRLSYPIVMITMFVLGLGMLYLFRKKGWF